MKPKLLDTFFLADDHKVEVFLVELPVIRKGTKGLSKVGIHLNLAGFNKREVHNVLEKALDDASKDLFPAIYLYDLKGSRLRHVHSLNVLWHDLEGLRMTETAIETVLPDNVIRIDFKARRVA